MNNEEEIPNKASIEIPFNVQENNENYYVTRAGRIVKDQKKNKFANCITIVFVIIKIITAL